MLLTVYNIIAMKAYGIWFFLILVFIFRFWSTRPEYNMGNKVRLAGAVVSEPVVYENTRMIKLHGLRFYLPKYPVISYGDYLIVEGKVDEKRKLKNAKLIDFQEKQFFLYTLRERIINFYQRALPKDHAALIAGMTIGSKKLISQGFYEKLKTSGTVHVVVASGMNVALVGGFLISIFVKFLKRTKALFFSLVGIWLYAVMSGFDAPIIRAAIMGTIAFSAQEAGRVYYAWHSLFLSAFLMLIIWPSWLTDVGFLLSFFATAGILVLQKPIHKRIFLVPAFFREDFSTTLAAQIAVSPILFFVFGKVNILSPLSNLFVLWTVPVITILGMVAGFLSLMSFALGRLVLLGAYPFSWWFIKAVELFA